MDKLEELKLRYGAIGIIPQTIATWRGDFNWLILEIEQLKKDLHSKVGGRSAAGLALVNQNLRLIKEKEWLKQQILLYQKFHPGLPYDEKMELLEVDMQQALKEG